MFAANHASLYRVVWWWCEFLRFLLVFPFSFRLVCCSVFCALGLSILKSLFVTHLCSLNEKHVFHVLKREKLNVSWVFYGAASPDF
jgi:hypothetical protein